MKVYPGGGKSGKLKQALSKDAEAKYEREEARRREAWLIQEQGKAQAAVVILRFALIY